MSVTARHNCMFNVQYKKMYWAFRFLIDQMSEYDIDILPITTKPVPIVHGIAPLFLTELEHPLKTADR